MIQSDLGKSITKTGNVGKREPQLARVARSERKSVALRKVTKQPTEIVSTTDRIVEKYKREKIFKTASEKARKASTNKAEKVQNQSGLGADGIGLQWAKPVVYPNAVRLKDTYQFAGNPVSDGVFTEHGINSQTATRILKNGVAAACLADVSDEVGLGKAELSLIVGIDRTTVTRLANHKKALPLHAAEGLLRVLELDAMAHDTFDSHLAALGWLNQKHPLLDDETPLQASQTSYGTRQVKDLLIAIKYGGVV